MGVMIPALSTPAGQLQDYLGWGGGALPLCLKNKHLEEFLEKEAEQALLEVSNKFLNLEQVFLTVLGNNAVVHKQEGKSRTCFSE